MATSLKIASLVLPAVWLIGFFFISRRKAQPTKTDPVVPRTEAQIREEERLRAVLPEYEEAIPRLQRELERDVVRFTYHNREFSSEERIRMWQSIELKQRILDDLRDKRKVAQKVVALAQ